MSSVSLQLEFLFPVGWEYHGRVPFACHNLGMPKFHVEVQGEFRLHTTVVADTKEEAQQKIQEGQFEAVEELFVEGKLDFKEIAQLP